MAARKGNTRPSDILGIEDDFEAFCVDEAVYYFGEYVKEKMEEVKGKTKAQRRGKAENVLRKYLGEKPKFRDISEIGALKKG